MSKFTKFISLVASVSFLASTALAQEKLEHGIIILNSLLFLVAGFLVMFMGCGFCMLEADLVRSKNTTMQLTNNISLFSLATIGYYIIGYNLMYLIGNWTIEGFLSGYIIPIKDTPLLEAVCLGPENADNLSYASTGSDYFFQLMFYAATASMYREQSPSVSN